MRVLRFTALFSCFVLMPVLLRADTPQDPRPEMRLLVVPFQRDGGVPKDWRLSLALPAAAAEELEIATNDPKTLEKMAQDPLKLVLLSQTIVLPDDAASMLPDQERLDLAAAAASARRRGATHLLTGRYDGRVENWSLTVEVYETGLPPRLVGSGARSGSIFNLTTRVVDMPAVQRMLAEATVEALAEAGVTLPQEAVDAFIAPSTENSWAFILLGRAYARHFWPKDASKHRTSLEMADNAVDVDPKYVEARRMHAWFAAHAEKKTSRSAKIAFDAYVEALKRNPDDVRSLLGAGELAVAQGDLTDAVVWLERAVKLRPESAPGHHWLGKAYAADGRLKDAYAALERARNLDPADMGTRRALADLYASERRYAEAAVELAAIVEGEPENLNAVFEEAACLRAIGKLEEAVGAYTKAERRFPKNALVPKFRADTLADLGRVEEANEAYARALRLAPKDARLNGRESGMLRGDVLKSEVVATLALREDLRETAEAFQDAANDASLGIVIRRRWPKPAKKDGAKDPPPDPRKETICSEARASVRLGAAQAGTYFEQAERYRASVRKMAAALRNGEGAALTPDRLEEAEMLVDGAELEMRVAREIAFVGDRILPQLLASSGCGDGDGSVADLSAVRARNRARIVPEDRADPSNGGKLTPFIPLGASRVVSFTVDNVRGHTPHVIVALGTDGKPSGEPLVVPVGRRREFYFLAGPLDFCLLPEAEIGRCGESGTKRYDYVRQGTLISVR